MNIKGERSADSTHKELNHIMWGHVGMGRTKEGPEEGLKMVVDLRKEFDADLSISGFKEGLSAELDKAVHLRDFLLMGELVAYDVTSRNESCGDRFREEYQIPEGEVKCNDENYSRVGCWKYQNNNETTPELLKGPSEYETIKAQIRNYKG